MASEATARVLSAEEIAARAAGGDIPFLRLPDRGTVFAERAMRLRQLAFGHPMREFLLFVARLADEQQVRLDALADVELPTPDALARAARDAVAPFAAVTHPCDPRWRDTARNLANALRIDAPAPLAEALDAMLRADDDWLQRQADRLLHQVMQGLEMATAPVIAAALQVHFTHLVGATGVHYAGQRADGHSLPFGRTAQAGACPCCASRPVAGITRLGADAAGQRYLACSLCATQWHMVRGQCSHCQATEGIAYESLQPRDAADDSGAARAAVQAEVCDHCGRYLKLMHMERDPNVDPCADDLATLALDLLLAEGGRQRHGVNLMLLFGDPAPEPPGDPGGG